MFHRQKGAPNKYVFAATFFRGSLRNSCFRNPCLRNRNSWLWNLCLRESPSVGFPHVRNPCLWNPWFRNSHRLDPCFRNPRRRNFIRIQAPLNQTPLRLPPSSAGVATLNVLRYDKYRCWVSKMQESGLP